MANAGLDTHQKALALNLDPTIYGTIAEIGAGQEVARWFLQVGAASGTVAKTISAYDMTVSDAIYGKVDRYVSRDRVEGMLEHEFPLLLERLAATKGAQTRFFAFADTISARNFAGSNECHGWLGIRFQAVPGGAPNSLILHVNLLDRNNLLQQQAVGILGVNLIYAVYHQRDSVAGFLAALIDELSGRLEIDLIALDGPDLSNVDERVAMLELLHHNLAEAVIFPVQGPPVPPSELLRKRPLVMAPDVLDRPEPMHAAMLADARARLAAELAHEERAPLSLFVLSARYPGESGAVSTAELQARVELLRGMGSDVLVARVPEIYRVVRYALRYTAAQIRIAVGAATVAEILKTRYYQDLDGELMEALANLFACNVRMYVHPTPERSLQQLDPAAVTWFAPAGADGMVTLEHLRIQPPISHLLAYLVESGFLHSVPAV